MTTLDALNRLIEELKAKHDKLEAELANVMGALAYMIELRSTIAETVRQSSMDREPPAPLSLPSPPPPTPKKERIDVVKAAVFGEPKPVRPKQSKKKPETPKKIKTQTAIFRMVLTQYYKIGVSFRHELFLHRSRIAAESHEVTITRKSCSNFLSTMKKNGVLKRYHTGEYARVL